MHFAALLVAVAISACTGVPARPTSADSSLTRAARDLQKRATCDEASTTNCTAADAQTCYEALQASSTSEDENGRRQCSGDIEATAGECTCSCGCGSSSYFDSTADYTATFAAIVNECIQNSNAGSQAYF
ncbi:hypothetical protein BKA62DRAFT_824823, partial [Auriculariales sp. MPI-PUGE-AT-0066]